MANLEATAKGAIYVFNVYAQDLNLSINGGPAMGTGNIPGWATGDAKKYQPQGLKVDRVLNENEGVGKFWGPMKGPGINQLILNWADGMFYATVKVKKAMNADLLLFIMRDKWTLVNVDDGTVADSGDVTDKAAIDALVRSAQSAASHGKR